MRFLLLALILFLTSCSVSTFPIPMLDTKGDVYKTEGENDPLIYTSTTGTKKAVMVYVDFKDSKAKVMTEERGKTVLGNGLFVDLFNKQSYSKLKIDIEHFHGWRTLPKPYKEYNCAKTETHRDLFIEVFAMFPDVNFLEYDYIMVSMTRLGNYAFGERNALAIPYKGKKINVALNQSSSSPYVLAHEMAHLMGLPDIYTYGGVEGPKNPAGSWDIMGAARQATGFLGWHRHKLKWLDADRKTYLSKGKHTLKLTSLNSSSGVSMITVPADNPLKPSKVFVLEIAQPIRVKKEIRNPEGVLIYSVDAKVKSGSNPVFLYPKEDKVKASFHPGDVFEHKDAPMKVKVLEQNSDGSYTVEIIVL